jgi:hypothetical protein
MPMHRRRVYIDRSSSRKARIEGWLSLSIFLSAAILLLSLLGCLPDLISTTFRWLLPERLYGRFGVSSGTDVSVFALPCEILMTFSGAYLVVALLLKAQTGRRPH